MKILAILLTWFFSSSLFAGEGTWVPPSERTGFVGLFMPTFEIPEDVFGKDQRKSLIYVGSIFESYRYGTGECLIGQDTYAQVWAIRNKKWALFLPRFDFFYPGASFAPPVKEGVIIGFSLRKSFR
jgi:hypothetical protein